MKKGFSLVEVLIGTAIFLVVGLAVYNAFVSLFQLANTNQARVLGVELADEQFEIIRNMPYVNVGLTNGIPQGVLPQNQTLIRGGFTFNVTLVIRNINLSTSSLQASSKLVEVDITCQSCQQNFPAINLTGQVSPANLQSAASGGALVIQVADSTGVPVQGATVTVQSTATSSITDTDVTDSNGLLDIIGVPPGYQVYHITATKTGYSTDYTSPNITIIQGQQTNTSLSIDKVSTLNIASVGPTCSSIGNFHFKLTGTKQIGGVTKYSQNLVTNGSGSLILNNMEGDTYTLLPTDISYDTNGITPFSPFKLNPGNIQSVQIVAIPASENSLMVNVQDGTTNLPLSGATVDLTGPSSYDQTQITGQGYFKQTDWSHGPTQNGKFVDTQAYAANNGGVDTQTSSSTGSILLHWTSFGPYNTLATGTLESSTFDTGTTSNFYALNWTPITQPVKAGTSPVQFQFATSPSSTPNPASWNYLGPDGTVNTYYTVPGTVISSGNNNAEFVRYKTFVSTQTATVTPSINDVSFSFTSGCTPPGQVLFQGLSAGTYTLTISKAGYTTQIINPVTIISGWQSQTIKL